MIYDDLSNIDLYCKKGDLLWKAVQYAQNFDLSQPDGEYEVNGRDLYAVVVSYDTEPAEKRRFESHNRYFDVQIVISGQERDDVAVGIQSLSVSDPYDPDKDLVFYDQPNDFLSFPLIPGRFAVYYPNDAHRPNCDLDGTSQVRKICMKVRIKD